MVTGVHLLLLLLLLFTKLYFLTYSDDNNYIKTAAVCSSQRTPISLFTTRIEILLLFLPRHQFIHNQANKISKYYFSSSLVLIILRQWPTKEVTSLKGLAYDLIKKYERREISSLEFFEDTKQNFMSVNAPCELRKCTAEQHARPYRKN
jgi:hypothetical protein